MVPSEDQRWQFRGCFLPRINYFSLFISKIANNVNVKNMFRVLCLETPFGNTGQA